MEQVGWIRRKIARNFDPGTGGLCACGPDWRSPRSVRSRLTPRAPLLRCCWLGLVLSTEELQCDEGLDEHVHGGSQIGARLRWEKKYAWPPALGERGRGVLKG